MGGRGGGDMRFSLPRRTHDGSAKELKPPGESWGAGGEGGRRTEGRQEPYGSLETVRRKRAAGRERSEESKGARRRVWNGSLPERRARSCTVYTRRTNRRVRGYSLFRGNKRASATFARDPLAREVAARGEQS